MLKTYTIKLKSGAYYYNVTEQFIKDNKPIIISIYPNKSNERRRV